MGRAHAPFRKDSLPRWRETVGCLRRHHRLPTLELPGSSRRDLPSNLAMLAPPPSRAQAPGWTAGFVVCCFHTYPLCAFDGEVAART